MLNWMRVLAALLLCSLMGFASCRSRQVSDTRESSGSQTNILSEPISHGEIDLTARSSTSPQGQWGPLMTWPIVAIHMGLTPEGRVIAWDRDDKNDLPHTKYDSLGVYIWDPLSGIFVNHPLGTTNLFCAGATWGAHGLLYVMGGHIHDNAGQSTIAVYDTQSNQWSMGPQMNQGRWYPTAVPLGNGEIMVLSGMNQSSVVNTLPQVLNPADNTLRNLPNAVFGYPLWPQAMLTKSGLVVTVGPDPVARYIDPTPHGAAHNLIIAKAPDRAWRFAGSAVMYDTDKILTVGGYNTNRLAGSDVAMDFQIGATPQQVSWKIVGKMAYARVQAVATVLPTGEVLVVGGGKINGTLNDQNNIVFPAELWNPSTKKFATMAAMGDARLYHSTALLLPDATVLSAGGGQPSFYGPDHNTAQIFYPPYLFAGPRPTITSAPKNLTFNEKFSVAVTGTIAQVSLVRAGMVTHAFDQSQRLVKLAFTQSAGTLSVRAPLNGNYAPPGHYMLFVVSESGVPSIAAMVTI